MSLSATAEGECYRGAHLIETSRVETHHQSSQPCLRDGHDVLEVDRARILHPIVGAEDDLRCDPADGRGHWRDCDARRAVDDRVAGENHHRPLLVGLRKSEESDVAPRYFSGHAATPSQAANSTGSSGVRSYASRSRRSRSPRRRRRRCSRSASRIRAERFTLSRRATRLAERSRSSSITTCIVLICGAYSTVGSWSKIRVPAPVMEDPDGQTAK